VKAMARFGIILVALFAVTGWILTKSYQTAPERRAILVSAILAAVIQIVGYAVLVRSRKRNAMLTGWGIGIGLRTIALVLYGLVFAKMFGLPLSAALMSFVVFLFASMLLESFLISYAS
jgi:hypothetical protein